jgi:hypothetical protein
MKTYEEMAESVLRRIKENEIKRKRRQRKVVSVFFAVVVSVLTAVNIGSSAFARNMPFIGSAFAYVQDKLGCFGLYSKYAHKVGEKAESNGISITMSEVFYDGLNLYVSYVVENDKFRDGLKRAEYQMKQLDYHADSYILCDGRKYDLLYKDTGIAGLEGGFSDERTFVGIETYYLEKEDLASDFKLHVDIDSVGLVDGIQESGEWVFDVEVHNDKDKLETYKINIENEGHTIDKVVVSPIMVTVYTSYPDIYKGTVSYRVFVYSDLSPDKDIGISGEYAAANGVTRIPRNRIGKEMDIYVFDAASQADGEKTNQKDVVERNAIVTAHVDLK